MCPERKCPAVLRPVRRCRGELRLGAWCRGELRPNSHCLCVLRWERYVHCQGASRASRASGASGRSLCVRTHIFFPDVNDVEHYVHQAGSMCPKATVDNQHIDAMWRFLTTKIFGWLENEMKRRGVETIPPDNYDNGITWSAVRTACKKQFVPEVAISVIRNEWHTLKFNKAHFLKFNRRALELIEMLGGPLTTTRDNPLWDEYKRKLPEATANDISQ